MTETPPPPIDDSGPQPEVPADLPDGDLSLDPLPSPAPPTICLDQFLKTCGVATGGQAKRLIQGGEVLVNGEVETRRRRKLHLGDEVQLDDDLFLVAWAEEEE